jgi:hypothetical protein
MNTTLDRLIDHMEIKVDNTSNNLEAGLKRMKDFINANAGRIYLWNIV